MYACIDWKSWEAWTTATAGTPVGDVLPEYLRLVGVDALLPHPMPPREGERPCIWVRLPEEVQARLGGFRMRKGAHERYERT